MIINCSFTVSIMEIQRFVVGSGVTNCYLIVCPETSEAVLVDPHFRGGEGEKILEIIEHNNLKLKYLVNTHGHYDHTSGNQLILNSTDAQLLFHEGDYSMISEPWKRLKNTNGEGYRCPRCNTYSARLTLDEVNREASLDCSNCNYKREYKVNKPDRLLAEGDRVNFGRRELTVLHTPGHSRGCICLYSEEHKTLFSGDTLFRRSIGRTDLPGASHTDMLESLRRLKAFPLDTRVYPGHGDPTSIKEEQGNIDYWLT